MADERTFPDVEFVETDTEAIVEALAESYAEEFGRELYPADPVYQLILWFASILSQERSYMNIAAKRNLPRYATGDYLDSLAEIFFQTYRQAAQPASCTVEFTLSEGQDSDVTIPAETEVSPDGAVIFATTEELVIAAGETSGQVTAECTTEGTVGNGYAAGTELGLMDQIAYVASAIIAVTSAGGTEEETDDELYYRMRQSYESYSTAGTVGAYKYLAMAYNSAVADVAVYELDPGQTGVTILMDTGVPTTDELADMQEYLSSDEVRPVTDEVIVAAPEAVGFTVDIVYYGASQADPAGEELADLVAAAVEEYVEWQTSKLGRRINPGKLIALVIAAGAGRVTVNAPVETALEETQCAVLNGEAVLTYGGEDE